MYFKFYVILVIVGISDSQSNESKWVWGSSGRSGSRSGTHSARIVSGERRYNGELVSKPLFQANSNYNGERQPGSQRYRYEVTEDSEFPSYRPRPPQSYRPDPETHIPYRPNPDFVRPTNVLVDNNRPTNRPNENNYYPSGNRYRPTNGDYSLHGLKPGVGTNGRPILTGPTPSWEDDGNRKYKDYDVCKCVHGFNCNSPGIRFGTCDTDKQYCCYMNKGNEGYRKPVTNVYERPRPRPILAGPGGPVDVPGNPYQNKIHSGRPIEDPDRELDEAYRKGLASTVHRYETRPDTAHYDRDRDRYSYEKNRDRYLYDRDSYLTIDNNRNSHSSKYGLYQPSVDVYARSKNSTISAIDE